MSDDFDFVVVTDFAFDESKFLGDELKTLTKLIKQPDSSTTTALQQYRDKINGLVDEYKSKTKQPKNISWTALDDKSVIDLYNRLTIHRDRIDFLLTIKQGQSSTSVQTTLSAPIQPTPSPDAALVEKQNELESLVDSLEQQLAQSQEENNTLKLSSVEAAEKTAELTIQITQLLSENERLIKEVQTVKTIETIEVEKEPEQNQEAVADAPKDETQPGYFFLNNTDSKFKTPKAVDYDMIKNNYIETLLAEIDRLTLLGQSHESKIRQYEAAKFTEDEELTSLKADKTYFSLLCKIKDDEIEVLNAKCDQWEQYANQQEKEVLELNEIILEQYRRVNSITAAATVVTEASKDHVQDGDEETEKADQVENEQIVQDSQVEADEPTVTSDPTTDDQIVSEPIEAENQTNVEEPIAVEPVIVEESPVVTEEPVVQEEVPVEIPVEEKATEVVPDEPKVVSANNSAGDVASEVDTIGDVAIIAPVGEEEQETVAAVSPPVIAIDTAALEAEIEKHSQIAAAAKDIAELTKTMLKQTQDELVQIQTESEELKQSLEVQKEHSADLERQLTAETEDRQRLVVELVEEREQRRSFKTRMEAAQQQSMKLMQENSQLVAEVSDLQTKIEHCLLNHGPQHDD